VPREGCYCRDGFVRNAAGKCVPQEQCGCRLPNGRGVVAVGQSVISTDCSKKFTCAGPQQNPTVENLKRCSPNAQCRGDENKVPKCFCKPGFAGDGFDCRSSNINFFGGIFNTSKFVKKIFFFSKTYHACTTKSMQGSKCLWPRSCLSKSKWQRCLFVQKSSDSENANML
jgi:hypothetical protein